MYLYDRSREETDYLFEVTYRFDLRWPVIADRYEWTLPRSTEELQGRFFDVIAKVRAARSASGLPSAAKVEPPVTINVEYEKNRRMQQENHFQT